MRRYATTLLATALAIFIASAPVAVSACDLSCWLHQGRSDCHSSASAVNQNDPMSGMDMSGMDMSRDNDQTQSVSAVHSMIHLDMAANADEKMAEFGRSHNSPGSLSPCFHEACVQTSVSASPPSKHNLDHAVPLVAVSEPLLTDSMVGIHRTDHGTSPPDIASVDRFTTLRI